MAETPAGWLHKSSTAGPGRALPPERDPQRSQRSRSDPIPVGRAAASGKTEMPAVPKLPAQPLCLIRTAGEPGGALGRALFVSALSPHFLISPSLLPYNRNTTRDINTQQDNYFYLILFY